MELVLAMEPKELKLVCNLSIFCKLFVLIFYAGIGVYWGDDHPDNVSEPLEGRPTNNRAEIMVKIFNIFLSLDFDTFLFRQL